MVHARHLWGAVLALSGGLAAIASADSITVTQTGISEYRIFDTSMDGGKTYHRTSAGALHWKRNDTQGGGPVGVFDTFCTELTQKIGYGKYNYSVVGLEDAPTIGGMEVGEELTKADLVRELWGRHRRDVIDSNTSAAFQLAVWEIIYDEVRSGDGSMNLHKSLDLKDGAFRVKDPIADQPYLATAQNWLWELDGTGPMEHLMAMTNSRYQDQVFQVPLPTATWAGLAIMLIMVTRKVRRAMAVE
ncbi:MAG: hypothetical protein NTU53_18590 [Planctomycetota bacterium]|nr:hypothetical protein [Planctomycetota bacterium]